MATQLCTNSPLTIISPLSYPRSPIEIHQFKPLFRYSNSYSSRNSDISISIRCSATKPTEALRTCKNCKSQFDPALNDPRSCRYHTAHFGGTRLSFLFIQLIFCFVLYYIVVCWCLCILVCLCYDWWFKYWRWTVLIWIWIWNVERMIVFEMYVFQ